MDSLALKCRAPRQSRLSLEKIGDEKPNSGKNARKKAAKKLKEKIDSLIKPGEELHGKVELISA